MATATPRITRLDGLALAAKARAVVAPAGSGPTVRLTLLDGAGNPVDLTPYAAPAPPDAPHDPLVQLRAAEACRLSRSGAASFDGAVVDAAGGVVEATVDPAMLGVPAVYEASFGVFDPAGVPAVVNTFYLVLEPSLFQASPAGCGPPRLAEVRQRVRDSDPAESRLLDATLFDDADVAQALVTAVQAWNAELPPVALFDTSSFPAAFRMPLLEGAAAQLLYAAAEWYRKNTVTIQGAGGVAVADMDRAEPLQASADARWQQFLGWARKQKVAINAARGFGRVGSPYRLVSWNTGFLP